MLLVQAVRAGRPRSDRGGNAIPVSIATNRTRLDFRSKVVFRLSWLSRARER
ncbi:MAG: hypothetical protein RLZZ458_2682 [Planctomycetota bacterium]